MIEHRLTFKPELQGLRAIAISLVILAHTQLAITPGGFVGVDVFFVLSGYLITALLLRELQQSDHINFVQFYANRLKRLLPALIFMIGVSFSVAMWLLSGVEAGVQLAATPFAVTWTSNLYYLFTTLDYFNELASRDIFLHTWSLGVEEQFYLIWPVVLLLLFKIEKLFRVNTNDRFNIIFPGLVIVFSTSFALSIHWVINEPQSAFYLMPARMWQLSLGAIVHLKMKDLSSNKTISHIKSGNVLGSCILYLGLISIFWSAFALQPNQTFLGFWILIPSFGTAAVIVSGIIIPKKQSNPLAHPVLVWFGDRSYSLYLWHWPIFVIAFSLGAQPKIVPVLCLVLSSLLMAILSFRLIEIPFWKGKLSFAHPRQIILVSFLIMATSVFLINRSLQQLPKVDEGTDLSNQWRTDVPIIYRMSCDAWYSNSRVEPCVFGTEEAEKTVVLLADSIGAQWFSIIPEIFPQPHWRTIVLTKSSCAMVDEEYVYQRIGKIYQVCTDWRNAVLDRLDTLKPDLLIMGSAATYEFTENQWIEGTSRILERVRKAANKVFIIPGTPSLGFDGPGCISRHITPEGYFARGECLDKNRLQYVQPVTDFLTNAANRFTNVFILNLNDLVCPDGNCSAVNDKGLVVFRDSQHLTDSFVRFQIPLVRDRFNQFLQE